MRLTLASICLALTTASAIAAPVTGQICDTGDRIYVVDKRTRGRPVTTARSQTVELGGSVVVIARGTGARAQAPIAAGSSLSDNCAGTSGGHAGCSVSGGATIRSNVLGRDHLVLGNFRRMQLVQGKSYRTCRDSEQEPWIVTCSTKSWFVVIGKNPDTPFIRIYEGKGEDHALQEDVVETSTGYAGGRASLSLTTVELDGVRETCLAVYRP